MKIKQLAIPGSFPPLGLLQAINQSETRWKYGEADTFKKKKNHRVPPNAAG
jgi:hypothetical protein